MKLILLFTLIIALSSADAERIVIKTRGHLSYDFFPLCTNYLEFNVIAPAEVHIILTNSYSRDDKSYEFVIDGWNSTRSIIKKDGKEQVVRNGTIIKNGTYHKYWVYMNDTEESVSIGTHYGKPLMFFQDPEYVKMSYFGIASGMDYYITWDFDYKMLKC